MRLPNPPGIYGQGYGNFGIPAPGADPMAPVVTPILPAAPRRGGLLDIIMGGGMGGGFGVAARPQPDASEGLNPVQPPPTQAGVDRLTAQAEAAHAKGADTSPVGHFTEGMARVANAMVGNVLEARAKRQQREVGERNRKLLSGLLGGKPVPNELFAAPDAAPTPIERAFGGQKPLAALGSRLFGR